jgi:hypothetical protein
MPRTTSSSTVATKASEGAMRFSMRNWALLVTGLVAGIAGFFALAAGSTVLAPLLLVLGYVILIPLGIIL